MGRGARKALTGLRLTIGSHNLVMETRINITIPREDR